MSLSEFYGLLNKGHWIILDNFERWGSKRISENGKIFPFAESSEEAISFFLDDNIKWTDENNTICCYNLSKEKYVSSKEASDYLGLVDPVKAILDSDYFLKKIDCKLKKIWDKTYNNKDGCIKLNTTYC